MNPPDIVQLIGVSTVSVAALIAVVGVTVRLALMPLIKAKRHAVAPPADLERVNGRLDVLEEEVRQLGGSMQRLAEAVEFDAQLRSAGNPDAARLPGAGA